MPSIFDPVKLVDLEIKNRIMMSPMCQYKATEGKANNWHFVHYVSRAIGGTGLIVLEMTNVEARGRITEGCLGIYNDAQIDPFKRIIEECNRYGTKVGIQIAHAGRKSTIPNGDIVAPSPIPFSAKHQVPRELTKSEIESIIEDFGRGTERAIMAGAETIELHGAHGYLIHQFMSPSSNKRTDEYGDTNYFAQEVIRVVRQAMPKEMPLIFRVSAVEYNEDGYSFEDMLQKCKTFKELGVDVFDVSTGGNGPNPPPNIYPAYQSEYAQVYKQSLEVPVISVGRLENPKVAECIVQNGYADMVCIGRGMLRNPYWAKEAARELGVDLELPGVYNLGL